MSHIRRMDDRHHLREATQIIGDGKIAKTVNAFDAIARGEYKGARSRTSASDLPEHVRPEGETWDRSNPAAVRAALERSRIIPTALTLDCEHAPVGVQCYVNGCCGDRIRRAVGVLAEVSAVIA